MACGTGKTLIALWVAERLHCQRTLVLMPSLSLLAQTMREWTAHASKPFDILPVCSDETVRGGDHLVSYTSELGLPVTTDPEAIASFLRRRGPRVVFSTYQSSPRIAEAFQLQASRFDLVIADEAHRCAGSHVVGWTSTKSFSRLASPSPLHHRDTLGGAERKTRSLFPFLDAAFSSLLS